MESCINCGQAHSTDSCGFPNYIIKCPVCLVLSLDGTGHSSQCRTVNDSRASSLRTHIYVEHPIPMFKMRVENEKDLLYMFNKFTGTFNAVNDGCHLYAHSIDGAFEIKRNDEQQHLVEFNATSLHRFSMAIAFFSQGAWRLRCRIVVTPDDGVLCFPMHKTFENRGQIYRMPAEFDLNTVLVMGIVAHSTESAIRLKVYANDTGFLNEGQFNGYFGQITWNKTTDTVIITDALTANQRANNICFSLQLYKVNFI